MLVEFGSLCRTRWLGSAGGTASVVGYISLSMLINFVHRETVMKVIVAGFVSAVFVAPLVFAGTPSSCPFTSKEVGAALGETFKEGKPGFESDFGTGKSMSCRYEGKNFSLNVKQTVMKNPSQTQGWNAALAGKTEKIPGDSDGAIRQTDQGDNTSPNLHYAREGNIVELRIMGIGKQNPRFGDLQNKLPGLRRLP